MTFSTVATLNLGKRAKVERHFLSFQTCILEIRNPDCNLRFHSLLGYAEMMLPLSICRDSGFQVSLIIRRTVSPYIRNAVNIRQEIIFKYFNVICISVLHNSNDVSWLKEIANLFIPGYHPRITFGRIVNKLWKSFEIPSRTWFLCKPDTWKTKLIINLWVSIFIIQWFIQLTNVHFWHT